LIKNQYIVLIYKHLQYYEQRRAKLLFFPKKRNNTPHEANQIYFSAYKTYRNIVFSAMRPVYDT